MTCQWRWGTWLPKLARLILWGWSRLRRAPSAASTTFIRWRWAGGGRSLISRTWACQITRSQAGEAGSSTRMTRQASSCQIRFSAWGWHRGQSGMGEVLVSGFSDREHSARHAVWASGPPRFRPVFSADGEVFQEVLQVDAAAAHGHLGFSGFLTRQAGAQPARLQAHGAGGHAPKGRGVGGVQAAGVAALEIAGEHSAGGGPGPLHAAYHVDLQFPAPARHPGFVAVLELGGAPGQGVAFATGTDAAPGGDLLAGQHGQVPLHFPQARLAGREGIAHWSRRGGQGEEEDEGG